MFQFPYYIVRFKLQTGYSSSFFLFVFPYYIVRFKQIANQEVIPFQTRFPYYIVRFKLYKYKQDYQTKYCFHTTQYDLNRITTQILKIRFLRFHTTQYDLNSIFVYIIFHIFICFHTTQYDLNDEACKCCACSYCVSILHSTI